MSKKVHAFFIALILIVFAAGYTVPQEMRILLYVSSFGFLGMISVIFVTSISLLLRINKSKFVIGLLTERRWLGIYSFILVLLHIVLVMHFFMAWNFQMVLENPYTFIAAIAFLMLAAMAATSNNASVRRLGRNWKRLHYLVYLVIVLVVIHSFNLGAVFMKEDAVKWIVVLAVIVVLGAKATLYAKKKYRSNTPA